MMAAGSLVSGAGLTGLSQVQVLWQYYALWTVLGIGMALVFYVAAFATINRAGRPIRAAGYRRSH